MARLGARLGLWLVVRLGLGLGIGLGHCGKFSHVIIIQTLYVSYHNPVNFTSAICALATHMYVCMYVQTVPTNMSSPSTVSVASLNPLIVPDRGSVAAHLYVPPSLWLTLRT